MGFFDTVAAIEDKSIGMGRTELLRYTQPVNVPAG
jgi:hypothetical protein